MSDIHLIEKPEELQAFVKKLKSQGRTVGVVPTMGALHAGHLSLVRASVGTADETVVTLFVNPTQFAPHEDFDKYPKQLESDLEQLEAFGRLVVFAPREDQIYPVGFSTRVVPPDISKPLEGEFRPTFFEGVATIVLKLLNLTLADFAFFGQKDFQQQAVIRRMVEDLNLPVDIRICPIVREPDGLAMSSRNAYLSNAEREIALCLSRTLEFAEQQLRSGQTDGFELAAEMRQRLIDGGVTSIDYATVADPATLCQLDRIVLPAVALIAAHVGKTRLIDNRLIVD